MSPIQPFPDYKDLFWIGRCDKDTDSISTLCSELPKYSGIKDQSRLRDPGIASGPVFKMTTAENAVYISAAAKLFGASADIRAKVEEDFLEYDFNSSKPALGIQLNSCVRASKATGFHVKGTITFDKFDRKFTDIPICSLLGLAMRPQQMVATFLKLCANLTFEVKIAWEAGREALKLCLSGNFSAIGRDWKLDHCVPEIPQDILRDLSRFKECIAGVFVEKSKELIRKWLKSCKIEEAFAYLHQKLGIAKVAAAEILSELRNDVHNVFDVLKAVGEDFSGRLKYDVDRGTKALEDFAKDTTERFMNDVGRGLKAADNITKGIGRWLGFR